jgi:hypothetical protein
MLPFYHIEMLTAPEIYKDLEEFHGRLRNSLRFTDSAGTLSGLRCCRNFEKARRLAGWEARKLQAS